MMAALFPDLDGHWMPSYRADPRACALYRRHYSSEKNARAGKVVRNFMGPGETLVLLTSSCDALFAWQRNVGGPRLDKQEGVCCVVFRNEGQTLSSDLIREADEFAWRRWPSLRHFTYVWDAKVRSSNPGACFKKAGWRTCGRNADGRLTILEILPPIPTAGSSRNAGPNGVVCAATDTREPAAGVLLPSTQAGGTQATTRASVN